MRRLLYFCLFVICIVAGVYLNRAGYYRDVFLSICELADEHYYKDDAKLQKWVRTCRLKAAQLPARVQAKELMDIVQEHMNEMGISHFQVYSPQEDRKLWKGEAVDTGIRARYVEDHLVVYKVFADSAGEQAGVRPGDEILALPGTEQVTPYGTQTRSGKFTIKRGEEVLQVDVEAQELVIDGKPTLQALGRGAALLEISSFRAEFFEPEFWKDMAGKLALYSHVLVDLRENGGGNFVAMLRALSTFHCGGKSAGILLQPRKLGESKPAFDDNTSDLHQIQELAKYRSLGLRTFDDYGCYKGKVTILMGPDTASVAEIFAHSFLYRKHSRVWGQPTAGDVILAVWYDLPALGRGYSVSIPEAVYLTPDHEELEGQGVYPERELYYDLALSLQGKDSWVMEALR